MPFPTAGDLPDPGIEPASSVSPSLAGRFFTTEPPGKPPDTIKSFTVNYPSLREMVGDREAWHAAVHGVSKSQTQLSD